MALTISNASGHYDDQSGSGVSSIVLTRLTTTGIAVDAGAIIVLLVATSNPTTLRTVSSITDNSSPTLTWAKRSSSSANGGFYSSQMGCEVWWAFASTSGQAGLQITVHLSGNADVVIGNVYAASGFLGTAYQTAPWDVNGSLPAIGSSTSAGSTTPTVTLSTTAANTIVLGNMACATNVASSQGSGYTQAGQPLFAINTTGMTGNSQYQVFSSPQTSIADNLSVGSSGWVFIGDALAQGVASPLHQMPSMGFG